MAAPSKGFTIIPDSAIDADSPLTADLMEDFRNNDIHLEEWLGKNYTAAVDHDHDGVNSAPITLAAYNAQHSVDINGATWSIATGSLGFTPQALIIHWAFEDSISVIRTGWGMAIGTAAGDQSGMSILTAGTSIDANDIMGFTTASGFNASFVNEQARVTVWGSGGVTIATQSGAWHGVSATLYANIQIWGA